MFGKPKIPENLTKEELEAAEPVLSEWERKDTAKVKNFLRVQTKIVKIIGTVFAGQVLLTGAAIPLTKAEKPKIESKTAKDLEKKVGSWAVAGVLTPRGTYKEAPRATPNITGWEKFGVSNEVVGQIVRETFPNGWYDRNLSEIKLSPEEKIPMTTGYNVPKDALAVCQPDVRTGGRHAIKFGVITKDFTPEQILSKYLSHELAHAHDFRYALIPPEKRLELFSKIVERLAAKNRMHSGYVEEINNEDKQVELDIKATEYFAEIVSEYLNDPVVAKYRMAKEDIEIVKGFLATIDPEFKPEEAAAKRQKLISGFVRSEMMRKLPKELGIFLGQEETKTYIDFVSTRPVNFEMLSAENFDRADFFNSELKQKIKKMPKEYTFLYRMWRASKRALIDGRSNYQSVIPEDVAGRGMAWASHTAMFNKLLAEFDGVKREQAKVFFEELDGLFDDFSDISMLLKLDKIQK